MSQLLDDTETQRLSNEAFDSFRKYELDKARETVRKLESADPIRAKLNYAICLYYKSFCKDPVVLLSTIASLNGKSESVESIPPCSELSPWFSEDIPFDFAYAVFNEAVISYQLHFWKRTCVLLETLYSHIGAFDDALVFRIWLLLFDVYLRLGCSDKAAIVFGFLERTFPSVSDSEDSSVGTLEVWGSPDRVMKSLFSAYPGFLVNRDKEDLQLLISYYRARLYLNLRSYKLFKKEIKNLMSNCEALGKSLVPSLLLKIRYEMHRGNPRKALRLVSNIPEQELESFPSMKCILLNNVGCIHIKLGRQNLAISYLSLAQKHSNSTVYEDGKDEKEIRSVPHLSLDYSDIIAYNMGLSLLVLGEYERAAQAFWKCAETFVMNARLWVRLAECCVGYDAQMECERESRQVNDLVEKVVGNGSKRRILIHSPCSRNREILDEDHGDDGHRSMLSLQYGAECARTALYLLNKKPERPNMTTAVSSTGENEDNSPENVASSSTKTTAVTSSTSEQRTMEQPTLENDGEEHQMEQGTDSLRKSNDMSLDKLENWQRENDSSEVLHETTSTTATKGQPTSSKVTSVTYSNHDDEDLLIRESALALLCYCCLSTYPEEALQTAKELMQMSHVSPEILFLAHLYGVEALCALGRPDEALEMLSPQILEIIEKCSNMNSKVSDVNIHHWSHLGSEMSTSSAVTSSPWNSNSESTRPNMEGNPSSFTDTSSSHTFHGVSLPNYPSSISKGGIISRGAIGITGTAAFYVNLSSVCVLKNKLGEAAAAITRALSLMPRSSAALLMSTYIKLREGDLEGAKDILKCHRVTSGFQSLQT